MAKVKHTVTGLVIMLSAIVAICVSLGSYFTYITVANAYSTAIKQRFSVTAEQIAVVAEHAASLGIRLSEQDTLAGLLQRSLQEDTDFLSISVIDRAGKPLFSSKRKRPEAASQSGEIKWPIRNNLSAVTGYVVLNYDTSAMVSGDEAIARRMRRVTFIILPLAVLASLLAGFLLAMRFRRQIRNAGDPERWPRAARASLAEVEDVIASAGAKH